MNTVKIEISFGDRYCVVEHRSDDETLPRMLARALAGITENASSPGLEAMVDAAWDSLGCTPEKGA